MEKQFHRNQRNCLIVLEEFGKWYESQIDEVREENSPPIDDELLQQIQKRADELLKQETESHIQSCRNGNRGEADWLDTVAQKGTFADRLSALQLRIKKSPVHSLNYLEQFVEIVLRKGAKVRQAYSITKMLKEIFLAELLPPNRKLLTFNQRPLEKWWKLNEADARKRLIMWKFEAGLKLCYQRFLNGLQSLASNMVEGVAQTACSEMAELLTERPEQEQFLLAALVNRLGHPQHRVGAKVAQMLELLVQKHPNMRLVVVKEIEQIIFRKNISPKTQRYALHFLSRMFFDAGEFELALHLIQIYLRFFRILVLKDAINEHRLLPLLVSGLNRAFPYAKGKKLNSDLVKDVESLYAIVQTAKFSTALSVLRLLFQIHNFNEGLSDRFYSAFYRRLLNLPSNPNSQLDGQLFDLVEKVLKNDLVESRVRAFLKRLFQVALANNAAFAAAALLACSRVVLQRPNLLRLDASLNSRIIGADEKLVPGKAGKSRAVSSKNTVKLELEEQGTSKSKPTTHWYSEGGANDGEEDEEEEEKYVDVKLESGEEGEEVHVNGIKPVKQEQCGSAGWVHRQISDETNGLKGAKPENHGLRNQRTKLFATRNAYDPTARNPLFSGADFTLDTELYTLARHYHPTVAAFAAALIKGEPIEYKGTPLADLSHIRFLDRFAFKNPKTRPDEGGKKPDLDDQTSQNSDDISLDEDSSIDEEEEETLRKEFSEDDSGDAVLSSSDDGSSYSEQEIEVVKAPTNKDPSKRKRFQRKESKKERQNVHRPAKKRLRITA